MMSYYVLYMDNFFLSLKGGQRKEYFVGVLVIWKTSMLHTYGVQALSFWQRTH